MRLNKKTWIMILVLVILVLTWYAKTSILGPGTAGKNIEKSGIFADVQISTNVIVNAVIEKKSEMIPIPWLTDSSAK